MQVQMKPSREAIKKEVKISLTPMIDVVFLILIFFMCTLQFKQTNRKFITWLPSDRGFARERMVKPEIPMIRVRVLPDDVDRPTSQRGVTFAEGTAGRVFGRMRLQGGGRGRADASYDPPDTMGRIETFLRRMREIHPDLNQVKISVDPRAPHAVLAPLLDSVCRTNYDHVIWSGIPPHLLDQLLSGRLR